jgi:hypothetical protein
MLFGIGIILRFFKYFLCFVAMILDPAVLRHMGVELSPGPVPIPLYAQKKMVDDDEQPIPRMIVSHIEEVDPETQYLASLVLQITDGKAFRRYVAHERK